jgi:hypothetical protein
MDEVKTEVAWIFAGERPGAASKKEAEKWKLKWRNIVCRFDIKAKPTGRLGFFIDCRFNWQAHVRHRLALGSHRIRTTARVMHANGIREEGRLGGSHVHRCLRSRSYLGRLAVAPRLVQQAHHNDW